MCFSSFRRWATGAVLIALALLAASLSTRADQITKNDGSQIQGTVVGVADGQVTVESQTSNGGSASVPYSLADIKSVVMAPPADVAKLGGDATPGQVIATLEPEVNKFSGLPADWVVAAMAQLAQAYAAENQSDRAASLYSQIDTLYPGSKYHAQAVAGKAMLSLKQGKVDEALADVQPIIDQANQDIAPSPADGAIYANAFLVYGQALEAQKKPQQALEAYLTVKTMFYQDPALVAQAEQLAKSLRDQNPGIGVE